jgi:nucleotide-binding universal stress UspA family protein
MIKQILFAADLGAFTSHALLHVEFLARQFQARVIVVHAVPPMGEFAAAVVKSHCPEDVKREILKKSRMSALLESIREEIFETLIGDELAELNVAQWIKQIVVVPGSPAAVILEQAERFNVDLVVIGSHSPDADDGCLLGSVAAKVLQLSRIPVLLVPMAKDPFGSGGLGPDISRPPLQEGEFDADNE